MYRIARLRLPANGNLVGPGAASGGSVQTKVMVDKELQHAIAGGAVLEKAWSNQTFTFPYDPGIGAVTDAGDEPNWGFDFISANKIWNAFGDGKNIKVAILDSGLDATHPAFAGTKISMFVDIDNGSGKAQQVAPFDSGWHGTHCAGILCGKSTSADVARGIAPGVELHVAKVLNGFDGSTVSVFSGLQWALDQGCKVISLSFGWPGMHDVWAEVIKKVLDAGAILFCGIGNEFHQGEDTISPANYPDNGVISVGAHDQNGDIWEMSGGGNLAWGPNTTFAGQSVVTPFLASPGVGIVSAAPGGKFRRETGTSMATPHAAAVAACIWSKNPADPASAVLQKMSAFLVHNGDAGQNIRYGFGLIKPVM